MICFYCSIIWHSYHQYPTSVFSRSWEEYCMDIIIFVRYEVKHWLTLKIRVRYNFGASINYLSYCDVSIHGASSYFAVWIDTDKENKRRAFLPCECERAAWGCPPGWHGRGSEGSRRVFLLCVCGCVSLDWWFLWRSRCSRDTGGSCCWWWCCLWDSWRRIMMLPAPH